MSRYPDRVTHVPLVGEAQERGYIRRGVGARPNARDEVARLGAGIGMGGCAHGRGYLIDGA